MSFIGAFKVCARKQNSFQSKIHGKFYHSQFPVTYSKLRIYFLTPRNMVCSMWNTREPRPFTFSQRCHNIKSIFEIFSELKRGIKKCRTLRKTRRNNFRLRHVIFFSGISDFIASPNCFTDEIRPVPAAEKLDSIPITSQSLSIP